MHAQSVYSYSPLFAAVSCTVACIVFYTVPLVSVSLISLPQSLFPVPLVSLPLIPSALLAGKHVFFRPGKHVPTSLSLSQ